MPAVKVYAFQLEIQYKNSEKRRSSTQKMSSLICRLLDQYGCYARYIRITDADSNHKAYKFHWYHDTGFPETILELFETFYLKHKNATRTHN